MINGYGKLVCNEVRIENCSVCNANCSMCPREEMTRSQQIMGNEHFYELMWQIVELGARQVSIFGFGEPLLDNHLPYKVELATEDCGLETHITTNASLLTPQSAKDLLSAGLSNMRFSIHALSPRTFSRVHKGLNWDTVTKNMDYFRKLNDKLGHPCTIHTTCIPHHQPA